MYIFLGDKEDLSKYMPFFIIVPFQSSAFMKMKY